MFAGTDCADAGAEGDVYAGQGGIDGDAKAELEHRYYPYDLKGLKLTKLGMIPSLIPSVPTGDNRTKSILILFAYTNFDFIYIINTYIASSRI